MSLLDDIKSISTRNGPVCSVQVMLDSLTPEDREAIETAMADLSIRGSAIAKTLRDKRNIKVTDDVLRYHRRGDCTCRRS